MSSAGYETCLGSGQMRELLAEKLSEQEERPVLVHLDECAECRKRLECLAVAGVRVGDIEKYLKLASADFIDDKQRESSSIRMLRQCIVPSDDPLMLGRLGNYQVCGLIGRGGTGIVVKAFDAPLNRYVAIKILLPSLADDGALRRRFEREAHAIAAVSDPNVVAVYSVNEFLGLPYIVMQYLAGGSLQQYIHQNGPLSTCEATRVGMQIAKALEAAHSVGIIHRDVKPGNVMLADGIDRVLVADFGLAKVTSDVSLTGTGSIAGTPQFMSPEQASGGEESARSDLFSLGSTLYAVCTGRPPFGADTVFGMIRKVCEDEPRPIRSRNPDIAPWFAALVERLMVKSPSGRFRSAGQVAECLRLELAHMRSSSVEPERFWYRPRKRRLRSIQTSIAIGLIGTIILVGAFLADMVGTRQSNDLDGEKSKPETLVAEATVDRMLVEEFDVQIGGHLQLLANYGSVHVTSGNTAKCRIEIVGEINNDLLRFLNSNKIVSRNKDSEFRRKNNASVSVDLPESLSMSMVIEVTIPRRFNIDVKTTSADVELERISGKVDITTNSGSIYLSSTDGDVEVYSKSGAVEAGDISGSAMVETNGTIRLGNVDGATKIYAADRSVTVGDVGGLASVEAQAGDVTLGNLLAGAFVSTTSGQVSIQRADLFANLKSISGEIDVNFSENPTQRCELETESGNIFVGVKRDFGAPVLGIVEFGTLSIPTMSNTGWMKDDLKRHDIGLKAYSTSGNVKFQILD